MKTLITENKKYIPGGLRYSNSSDTEFIDCKQEGLDYIFNYCEEKNGFSVHFQDKDEFDKFPDYIQVVSGAWYGENGRWSPLESIVGQLRFSNVLKFEKGGCTENNKFTISKKRFSKRLKIEIKSTEIGVFSFLCDAVIPMPILKDENFNLKKDKWEDSSEAFDFFRKEIS